MGWAMSRGVGIGSRIGTAAVLAALATGSALSVSAPSTFAAPIPLDPDCAVNPTSLFCETNETNIPTNPDDPRCAQMPLSASCEGGPWDNDDINGQ
jgi:hypothetical protein